MPVVDSFFKAEAGTMLPETIAPTSDVIACEFRTEVAQATQFNQRRLKEIHQHFLASPYTHLHHLHLELTNNALVLRGSLPTYYLRQVAMTLAKKLDGVDQIVDRITVCSQH